MEIPNFLRHVLEAVHLRLVDPDGLVGIGYLLDLEIGRANEGSDVVEKFGEFQEMKRDEIPPVTGQFAEQHQTPGQRQAREVNL